MKVTGYRAMWAVVFFDLPVSTRAQRGHATAFRLGLLRAGFERLQFSVYARPCPSEESLDAHVARVRRALPPGGQVRIMKITDRQFERMLVFEEKRSRRPECMPEQLVFF